MDLECIHLLEPATCVICNGRLRREAKAAALLAELRPKWFPPKAAKIPERVRHSDLPDKAYARGGALLNEAGKIHRHESLCQIKR